MNILTQTLAKVFVFVDRPPKFPCPTCTVAAVSLSFGSLVLVRLYNYSILYRLYPIIMSLHSYASRTVGPKPLMWFAMQSCWGRLRLPLTMLLGSRLWMSSACQYTGVGRLEFRFTRRPNFPSARLRLAMHSFT